MLDTWYSALADMYEMGAMWESYGAPPYCEGVTALLTDCLLTFLGDFPAACIGTDMRPGYWAEIRRRVWL